ncbi:MAG: hypothetical protein PHF44_00510 [Candidatus Pacebacteria bacterium]|nr:hypothetical protein [Candidatus Paceibacterota bacterium]
MKINNPFSKNNILILSPVILVMLFDLVFTLVGQPKMYWKFSYEFFNEGSPLGEILLGHHPVIFILFFAAYMFFVLFLTTNLKRPFNIIFAMGFFLGHAWGSSSWVPGIAGKLFQIKNPAYINDWYFIIGYFIFISIISGICINIWFKNKANS